MNTKEDILEQIVGEYLIHRGYFVQHNVKFRPRPEHPHYVSNQDRNHSDIDVVGIHPKLRGYERVVAVSCKSWQSGFNAEKTIAAIEHKKKISGRVAWKSFRELCEPKWSEAFLDAVRSISAADKFTYITAVAKTNGKAELWENYKPFSEALNGNPIKLLTFRMMIEDILPRMSTTL